MTTPLIIRALDENDDDARWDDFVRTHPEGTFFHLLGWRRVIARTYGRRAHYLYAESEGQVEGVLPLFDSGDRPFSRSLVSVPVGVSGGILANDDAAATLLRGAARALAERERIRCVEYKSERALFPEMATKADLYVTFRETLIGDREKQLAKIPRKSRAVIRAAERSHLRADFNRDDLEAFLDIYALSLRNLGTPMFPRALFEQSLQVFPGACDFLSIRHAGRIVGVVMNYYFRDVMLPFYAGVLPEARDLGVNNYVYWVMLERGYDRGFRTFDFGRSKVGTGAYHFKRHFGMREEPLAYQYDLLDGAEMPNMNPTNPRYEKAIKTWQRLPIAATKLVGPWISRRIP
ncbi:MAG: FemAB family PEP-CTERM system-associated protein [Deltaproteobacteria bacterium]|nr:FemAB family PEP-CTERM system-associated protein [Deltaproteobacteria bacterium]